MRRPLVLALVLAAPVVAAILPPALGADFKRFFGTFVGRALEAGPDNSPREERDIDLMVRPEGKVGIALSWTNVTLVDGRRDVPGVKRRADEVRLVPHPTGSSSWRARPTIPSRRSAAPTSWPAILCAGPRWAKATSRSTRS